MNAMPSEVFGEFCGFEAAGVRVFGEGTQHPCVEDVTGGLLEEKPATGTEHPSDLADRVLPLPDVVEDAEVDDGVKRSGRMGYRRGASGAEPHLLRGTFTEPPFGTVDYGRVKVEGGDAPGAEPVEQDFDAYAATAADLQDLRVAQLAVAELGEPGGLLVVLMRAADGVVHGQPFNGVQLHLRSSSVRRW